MFVQYMLSTEWYWDDVGTYQHQHRVIYLGLHNKYGHYQWTDNTRLA